MKKIFAVFFLLVFIFPFVETGLHKYAHRNDFHCIATTRHFHKAEHHCNLCDFTTDFFSSPPHNDGYRFQLGKVAVLDFFFSENPHHSQSWAVRSPRAPPARV